MNAITVLEDNHLFSNFRADLKKALQDVNRAFGLDCLCNKKQSTIKDFFQKVANTFIKKRQEEKKNSLLLNSTVYLIQTLIFPPLRSELERLSIIRLSLSLVRT